MFILRTSNPADELEKLIPNQRSVEFFFSKGVYLKGLNEWKSVSSGFNLVDEGLEDD